MHLNTLFERNGGFREHLQSLQVVLHAAPRVVALGSCLQLQQLLAPDSVNLAVSPGGDEIRV